MSNGPPHSGSRWEPTASSGEAVDGADDTTERVVPPADPARDETHEAAADERPGAAMSADGETTTDRIATPAAHPALGLGVFPAVPVGASPKPPRNRRRAGVLAAVAAGLLALGGVGGYAIGRAADGPPTGLAGATGEYGHHRGPSDAVVASGVIGTATAWSPTARRAPPPAAPARRARVPGVPGRRRDHHARDAFRPAGAVDRQPRRPGRRRCARRRRRRGRRRAAAGHLLVGRRRRPQRPRRLGRRR